MHICVFYIITREKRRKRREKRRKVLLCFDSNFSPLMMVTIVIVVTVKAYCGYKPASTCRREKTSTYRSFLLSIRGFSSLNIFMFLSRLSLPSPSYSVFLSPIVCASTEKTKTTKKKDREKKVQMKTKTTKTRTAKNDDLFQISLSFEYFCLVIRQTDHFCLLIESIDERKTTTASSSSSTTTKTKKKKNNSTAVNQWRIFVSCEQNRA